MILAERTIPADRPAPEAEDAGPQRRCVVTRERQDRQAMVRLALAPDGRLVPDIEERLPGRGLWISARRDIVERAVTKRLLARAAGAEIAVPPDLPKDVSAKIEDTFRKTVAGGEGKAFLEKAKFETNPMWGDEFRKVVTDLRQSLNKSEDTIRRLATQ